MRKRTVFDLCEAHASWGGGYRTAECVVEGGLLGKCSPRLCRVLPGLDFYAEGCTDEEFAEMVANWAANR